MNVLATPIPNDGEESSNTGDFVNIGPADTASIDLDIDITLVEWFRLVL